MTSSDPTGRRPVLSPAATFTLPAVVGLLAVAIGCAELAGGGYLWLALLGVAVIIVVGVGAITLYVLVVGARIRAVRELYPIGYVLAFSLSARAARELASIVDAPVVAHGTTALVVDRDALLLVTCRTRTVAATFPIVDVQAIRLGETRPAKRAIPCIRISLKTASGGAVLTCPPVPEDFSQFRGLTRSDVVPMEAKLRSLTGIDDRQH